MLTLASSQASPPSEGWEKRGRRGMAQSRPPSSMTFHVVSCFTTHRPRNHVSVLLGRTLSIESIGSIDSDYGMSKRTTVEAEVVYRVVMTLLEEASVRIGNAAL